MKFFVFFYSPLILFVFILIISFIYNIYIYIIKILLDQGVWLAIGYIASREIAICSVVDEGD